MVANNVFAEGKGKNLSNGYSLVVPNKYKFSRPQMLVVVLIKSACISSIVVKYSLQVMDECNNECEVGVLAMCWYNDKIGKMKGQFCSR